MFGRLLLLKQYAPLKNYKLSGKTQAAQERHVDNAELPAQPKGRSALDLVQAQHRSKQKPTQTQGHSSRVGESHTPD